MDMLKDRLEQAMLTAGMARVSAAGTTPDVAALVKATGLSKSAIHFILNGDTKAETIRAFNIDKLAEALNCNRDWLLYGDDGVRKMGLKSHSPRLSPDMLPKAHEWMRIAIGAAGAKELPLEDDLPLLAEAYNFAVECGWDTRKAKWDVLRAAIVRRDQRKGSNDERSKSGGNTNGS